MDQVARLSILAAQLSLVSELAARMSGERDPDRLEDVFASRAKWIIEHDLLVWASCDALAEGCYRIERVNRRHVPWNERRTLPALYGGLIGRAIRQATPLVCENLGPDPCVADPLAEHLDGVRHLLVCPVRQFDRTLHAACFGRRDGRPFSEDEVRTATLMATLASSAMANLDLYHQVAAAYRELDREFETVGQIQRDLLPAAPPPAPGYALAVHYATCQRAGGDYYDFFSLPGGRIGVWVADVSGHGAPAAVVMAMTRVVLHDRPELLGSPAQVLCAANRALALHRLMGLFVTAFYGVLDPPTGQFTYAAAGHNPPLLHRAATGEVEELGCAGGLPLAVLGDSAYSECAVTIGCGDRLLLFTDGLTEAFDAARTMYGTERLVAAVRAAPCGGAHEFRDFILADCGAHTGGQPAGDDCTIIAVVREAAAPPNG